MKWLDNNKPFFYSIASVVGKPVANQKIDTAQVSFSNGEILFEANPDFLDTLTDEEIAAVIAHESYHIILNHLLELKDESYPNTEALKIAQEVIINDSLTNSMFLLPNFVLFGKDYIGDDASTYSTKEAYKILSEKFPQSDDKDDSDNQEHSPGIHEHNQSIADEDIKDFKKAVEKAFNQVKEKVDDSDGEIENAPEEIKEAFNHEPEDKQKRNVNSDTSSAAEQEIESNASLTTEWIDVLKIINPKFGQKKGMPNRKTTTDWFKRDRRIAHMYPKILAPSRKITNLEGGDDGVKPTILLALDFSYSIPKHMQKVLAELGQSVPEDMFEAYAVTFSTRTVDFNVKSAYNKTASGGTEFGVIEKKALQIQAMTGIYPYVLVLTDGEASFSVMTPSTENLNEKWFWFGIDNNCTFKMKNNKIRYAGDIFKNVYGIPHKESRM